MIRPGPGPAAEILLATILCGPWVLAGPAGHPALEPAAPRFAEPAPGPSGASGEPGATRTTGGPDRSAGEGDPLGEARARGYATLEDCYRAASVRNETIGQARESVTQAEMQRRIAISQVLPQVTAEATYYRQNSVSLPPTATAGASSGFSFFDNHTEALVRLKQPIFAGLREDNYYKIARENVEASRFALGDVSRQLYGSVSEAFYQVLQREANVTTLQDTVRLERERLGEIEARRDVGLARKTEVLLSQSQLAADQSALTRALNDVKLARDHLGFLLGSAIDLPLRDDLELPPETLAAVPTAPPEPYAAVAPEAGPGTPPPPGGGRLGEESTGAFSGQEEALVRDALASRSDLLQKERLLEAARRRVAFERGAYAPVVDLEATYILDRENFSLFQQKTDWTAQLNFTVPLFDGGRIRANVATAKSQLQQAQLDRDQLERQIRVDVHGAWLTVLSDASQLRTIETQVASAEENYHLVAEEYTNGLATNLEVFAAQNQLLASRLELDQQKFQVKLDWLGLKVVQGLLPAPAPSTARALGAAGAGAALGTR